MLAQLTLQLAAFPERGWPPFAAAEASGLALPSPLRHAVGAASLSVLATFCGSALRSGATVGGVVLHSLAAVVGYVGAAAIALEVGARWLAAPQLTTQVITKFTAGAVLPVVVSGIANVIPLLPMSFALAFAGAAASVHSGWVGARALLALEGQARKRAAVVPAGVAVGLVLLATLARTVLPT